MNPRVLASKFNALSTELGSLFQDLQKVFDMNKFALKWGNWPKSVNKSCRKPRTSIGRTSCSNLESEKFGKYQPWLRQTGGRCSTGAWWSWWGCKRWWRPSWRTGRCSGWWPRFGSRWPSWDRTCRPGTKLKNKYRWKNKFYIINFVCILLPSIPINKTRIQ